MRVGGLDEVGGESVVVGEDRDLGAVVGEGGFVLANDGEGIGRVSGGALSCSR